MKRTLTLGLILVFFLTSFAFAEQPKMKKVEQPEDIPTFFGYVQGEIIVQFEQAQNKLTTTRTTDGIIQLGIASLDEISRKYEVTGMRKLFPGSEPKMIKGKTFDLSRYYKIKFDPMADVETVLEEYRNDPNVISVEPIGIHRTFATPNDGSYPDQWHLNQASDHDIDAPEAWDVETGDGAVIVAILDSGVRYFHKDLGGSDASYSNPQGADGNMWINWAEKNGASGVDDDGNGFVDDWVGWDFVDGGSNCWSGEDCDYQDNDPRDFNGHGTHCAGNVGAINNNGYATCAPSGGWGNGTLQPTGNGVKVMACRIGWSGRYWFYEVGYVRMDFIAEALYYAADNGARIASCSWGSSNTGGLDAALDYFVASGGLVFKAAGNDGSQTADYMCGRSDVISVAATDSTDNAADFTTYGTWVDICAPGTGILSSYHDHGDPQSDYVAAIDGTSMATPLAASVAALIWSQNLSWSASQVENQLYASAENIDAYLSSAYIGKMGAGRINAFEAVNTGTPPPAADFSGSPTSGCAALTVNFTDLSSGDITSWDWDFGDGGSSTAQNPSHQYSSAGTYTVSLTVTGPGGSDTETKTNYITVNGPPTAGFSGSPTSGTEPLTVSFTDQSTGGATSWDWDFGDGGTSTAQNPTHEYTTAGTYTVTLTATNACGSDIETKTDYITVNPCVAPTADFAGSPTSGDAPLTVSFTDQSSGNPSSWDWDFGDGGTSTAQNPSHEYTTAGTYTVTLTATNACGSDIETKTDYITVTEPTPAPVAAFSGTPTSGCAPLTVAFTDESTGEITSWDWDFGDGGTSTAQNPSHEYISGGTYTVSLTVTGPGGSDTETKTDYVTVNVAPTAGFSGSPTSGDYPLTVNFTDQSSGNPTSWDWDFGDGGTSTAQNPSHEYTTAGTYTVTLTAANACGSDIETKTDYITVTEPSLNTMHVHSISVSRQTFWLWSRGVATVTIYDQNNNPVSSATVYGSFSGPTSSNVNGTTNSSGQVTFTTGYIRTPSSQWCFEVTNVVKTDWTYDSGANQVTKACEDGPVYNSGSGDSQIASFDDVTAIPQSFGLDQNYPNPFNPMTTISFTLPTAGFVNLEVYNIAGQRVDVVVNEYLSAGPQSFDWDGSNQASGVYLYRLSYDGMVETKKMILLK